MAALSLMLGILSAATVAEAGIYPDGHFDKAKELTTEDIANEFVKENVDKGKTAPSWNKVVDDFHDNGDVAFGDVVLSSAQVRTIHGEDQGAGSGGWPTIRYFNKETGYGGKAYPKKTEEAMCDELGPKNEYMQQYVEEQGGTSLCNVNKTEKGCSDKAKEFIGKWISKPGDEIEKQLSRLKSMAENGKDMKPEAFSWVKQRMSLFKQLSQPKKQEL